jgi:hypothetical protein
MFSKDQDLCNFADDRRRGNMPTIVPAGEIASIYPAETPASSVRLPGAPVERDPAMQADKAEISAEGRQQVGDAANLTAEDKDKVAKLVKRDLEVRVHEQAHIMAGGALVRGGASFQYQTGPDGKQYATGGEVSIDTSAVDGDPRATIRKAQQIQKAALAPASPSGQDRAVAAEAAAMALMAQRELAQQTQTGSASKSSFSA